MLRTMSHVSDQCWPGLGSTTTSTKSGPGTSRSTDQSQGTGSGCVRRGIWPGKAFLLVGMMFQTRDLCPKYPSRWNYVSYIIILTHFFREYQILGPYTFLSNYRPWSTALQQIIISSLLLWSLTSGEAHFKKRITLYKFVLVQNPKSHISHMHHF